MPIRINETEEASSGEHVKLSAFLFQLLACLMFNFEFLLLTEVVCEGLSSVVIRGPFY